MFSQKLWLVVIANTLLLQCCIADEALSTVKTSSGRSLYSNVESQNSNIEITPDSFSKSDSSFAASQSELSQNESSMVNTDSGTAIQDSSFYSSSNNVSGSSSNTVASDGFISQTDSSFESSSSTTAESDTSIVTTPDSTVVSSTTSSATSTSSSSSFTSSSVGGQFLDSNEADISFPDDFPPIGPYETKSLDSIPDFDDNSMETNPFLNSPNSKFPPSLGFKPFSGSPNNMSPPNFPKFPNSPGNNPFKKPGPKGPYIPAGSFNSKPTPKIGTPVGPAGMNTPFMPDTGDNPFNSPDISKPFPLNSNSPINSPMKPGFDKPFPADSLPSSPFQNNDLPEPLQSPFPNNDLNMINNSQPSLIDDETTESISSDLLQNDLVPKDISPSTPDSLLPNSNLPLSLNDQPMLGDIPSASIDSSAQMNQYPSPDSILDHTPNPLNIDVTPNSPLQPINPHESFTDDLQNNFPSEFHPNTLDDITGSPNPSIDLHPSSPYDSTLDSAESDIPIQFHHDEENNAPMDFHPDIPSQFSELPGSPTNLHSFPSDNTLPNLTNDVLEDYPSDSPVTTGSSVSSSDLFTNTEIPTDAYSSIDDTTIISPYDSASEMFYDDNSPFENLQSQKPYDLLKDSPTFGEDIPTPETPYNTYLHPELPPLMTGEDSTPTLVSMDSNQDGFISPEEILESNNPSPSFSPLENTEQPAIPDSAHLSQPGYDVPNLPDNEHLNSDKFSPNDDLSVPLDDAFLPQQPNPGHYYPQNPTLSPYDQTPTPTRTYKSKPLPQYPGFKQPYLNYPGYPGNEYPQYPNGFSFPNKGPFRKYPPYLPYYGNDLDFPLTPFSPLYPYPYGTQMMPSPYDYPGRNTLLHDYPVNYLPPSPMLNGSHRPDFYKSSPPFSSGNPLLNRPLYPGGLPFESIQRPQYVPKNWSNIPTLKGPQIISDSLLPSSPANLDLLPQNQPLLDSPDYLLSQSPLDSSIPHSPLIQPSLSQDLNTNSPFMTDTLLSNDSPLTSTEFPPSTSLNLDNASHLSTSDASPYSPLEMNSNSPFSTPDIQNTPFTPNSIDDEIFNILKQQYESTTAEYQLSNSVYPQDISANFDTMTDNELTFNFVILGSSPAALAALKTLSDTGKSILLVERGDLPPHISKSYYYRPKILQSDCVRRIKSSAPHCSTEKILYAPNVLGEESTYDSNVWDYGVRSKYIKWGKLGKKWIWNNIIKYFTDSSDQPFTCGIPVSTEIQNTKAVNTVTSIFNDAGLYRTEYEKGKRLEGLTVIPYLNENGENIILAEKTFQQLTSYTNILLALSTVPESIVFDNVGKAIGVVVKTPCGGTKTITILDELIIGSNPIDTVQFLYQSGIGDHDRLQQLNIPTQINLPYVGKELIITPLHFGVLYLFPQGTLLNDNESDFVGKDYLFGKYGLPNALSVDYFKAALNIYESREANVIFNFRVFSKSMSERLNSYIARLTHIDAKIKDFLTNLCQEYDLLLAVPQLTNVLSRGEIVIDNSTGKFEALVDTGMYKSKRDITIMQKALKVLKSISETETFKSLNGQVVQIPVEQCGQPDFSTEYNRCSIRYLSLPNLHYCGGTIMGVSPLTSVVNEDLLVHGTLNVRIFSSSVVPYGTSTDSSAVSSVIGNLGAHIISQTYIP